MSNRGGSMDHIWRQVDEALGQAGLGIGELADEMRRYYAELRARGFSEAAALQLVTAFQASCIALYGPETQR